MDLPTSVARVRDWLAARSIEREIVMLPAAARTAAEAAAALGCTIAQIAKSLVFIGLESQSPVLVIASGANRVDEARVAALLGEPIQRATAAQVREATGYAIGGVPPFAHFNPASPTSLRTLIDEDLHNYDPIWAAAGHPHSVIRLAAQDISQLTQGVVCAVRMEGATQ